MTAFVVLDVFTDRPFGGNQLAVIPEAAALPEAALQKIAREFNFSETTFVYPPADPAHTARVRIFTPASELPFAGHPTIGTAVALARGGAGPGMVLELGIGPVEAVATATEARFTIRRPLARHGEIPAAAVAACAGLAASDLRGPAPVASLGVAFALAEVADAAALARATPVTEAFRALPAATHLLGLLLYVRDGGQVRARMFAPLDGVAEDPATGSAAAVLAAHLAEVEGAPLALSIAQGVEMGRPSRIDVAVAADGAITVAGQAVEVMRGTLTLGWMP